MSTKWIYMVIDPANMEAEAYTTQTAVARAIGSTRQTIAKVTSKAYIKGMIVIRRALNKAKMGNR
jgi:hypothetical protein